MNQRRKRRLYGVICIVAGAVVATTFVLMAFQENLLYFYSPTQVQNGEAPEARPFRVGGLVAEGSVVRDPDSLDVRFVLTDTLHEITVVYNGILPDLFREGQGIVTNGSLREDGVFVARQVLAKHDEVYMPPEVAEALAAAGAELPHGYGDQRKGR